jgi:hypothetical protein
MISNPKFLSDHGIDELPLTANVPANAELVVFDVSGNPFKVPLSSIFNSDTARGSMRLATPYDHTFNDVDWAVINFDDTTQEKGGIVCDESTGAITVPNTNVYEICVGVNAGFSGQQELQLSVFVNGTQVHPEPLAIQGRSANKPVSLYWEASFALNAGDVVDVRGHNGDSGSFTCHIKNLAFAIDEAR